ncbi:carcinine hydrolase/isopenicillin-N N-acyltransferase family protein [Roseomonas sp. CECT 9278]|uniref:carcinine hydrolase/isopenicillin-N N-acyltransferase family protein n=1 Tax=Roseomonas sp. CECT 9278 TaxID=2845823 RepID=UPI001E5C9B1D|nr:carcinine hydrolase/isopenicillin-N N-acyltransferase family protein [Roseomonas sp. CECT 9278]CAH0165634.1 hypothetical protein ROS9278_01070 [Roseomonas sp. CECT 9278]
MALRRIPVVDARGAGHPSAVAAAERAAETAAILRHARHHYGAPGVAIGDALSRRWLARNASPLAQEVAAVAAVVPGRGAHLLNLSFEWGCTSGVLDAPNPTLLRVLDWGSLAGLGDALCVIRQAGPAGDWLNIGWPGLAGAITALAPGRFAIAINQPPLPLTRLGASARRRGWRTTGLLADWVASRPATWRSRALPPAHLLRIACDTAPDYAAALALLRDTPVAAAVTFTIAGTRPGEAAVVERARDRAALRHGPGLAAANHWASVGLPGAARWRESESRMARMAELVSHGVVPDGFAWLAPPLLNHGTRLAAVMCPAQGRLELVAHEGEERVSEVLRLPPPGPMAR